MVSIVVISDGAGFSTGSTTSSSTAQPPAATVSASSRHRSTVIGVSVGAPLGALAIGMVSYILYQRRKSRNLRGNSDVYFPPDLPMGSCMSPPDAKNIPDAELDTQPNTFVELPANYPRSELEVSLSVASSPTNQHSAMATVYSTRWSSGSSPMPPRNRSPVPAAAAVPMPANLQIPTQQHYGSEQRNLTPEPAYRPYRPWMGTLPAIQTSESGFSLTTRPASIAIGEHGSIAKVSESAPGAQKREEDQIPFGSEKIAKDAHDGEKTDEDEKPHETVDTHAGHETNENELAQVSEETQRLPQKRKTL